MNLMYTTWHLITDNVWSLCLDLKFEFILLSRYYIHLDIIGATFIFFKNMRSVQYILYSRKVIWSTLTNYCVKKEGHTIREHVTTTPSFSYMGVDKATVVKVTVVRVTVVKVTYIHITKSYLNYFSQKYSWPVCRS